MEELLQIVRECDNIRPDAILRFTHLLDSLQLSKQVQTALEQHPRPRCFVLVNSSDKAGGHHNLEVVLPQLLSSATSLTSLSLLGLHISTLSPLRPLRGLRALRLEDMPSLMNEALRDLQDMTDLQLVSFNGCSLLDDQDS